MGDGRARQGAKHAAAAQGHESPARAGQAVGKSTLTERLAWPATADDSEFRDSARYAWSLRDDDTFVCTRGPDGGRPASRVAVSATTDPDRWNALGRVWTLQAPGRTWPRVRQSRAPSSWLTPPTSQAPPAGMSVDPLAGVPAPSANRAEEWIDLWSELIQIAGHGGVGTIDLGKFANFVLGGDVAPRGANPAIAIVDAHGKVKILAPTVQLASLRTGGLVARSAVLNSVIMELELTTSPIGVAPRRIAFGSATLAGTATMVGGQNLYADSIVLTGGRVATPAGGPVVGLVHFDRAEVKHAVLGEAPPVDLVVEGGSLHALGSSLAAALAVAAPKPGATPSAMPTVPKAPLAGTRISIHVDRLAGGLDETAGSMAGGFRRFNALLLRDDTGPKPAFPEVLASLEIADARLVDTGPTVGGTIGKLAVSGSPSFVLALLDSPEVRAMPDVKPVLDQVTALGLIPAAGASLTLRHVILGQSGTDRAIRGDLTLDVEVPGLGSVKIQLVRAHAEQTPGATTANLGHLTVTARDRGGVIAELDADGLLEQAGGARGGTLKHVRASGDVTRMLQAIERLALPPQLAAALAAVRSFDLTAGASLDGLSAKQPAKGDPTFELSGNAAVVLDGGPAGQVDVVVTNARVDTGPAGVVSFDRLEARLRTAAKAREAITLVIDHGRRAGDDLSADLIDLRGDATQTQALLAAIRREGASLPPLAKHALDVARRLDLDGAQALVASKKPKQNDPWKARTGAHVGLTVAGVGTLGVTLRGLSAAHGGDTTTADFESLELTLDDTRGKRVARIMVKGGHGYTQDAAPGGSSADVGAQLDDVVIEGNTTRLLHVLDADPRIARALPGPAATALRFLREHRAALSATGGARAQDLAMSRIDGHADATSGTITARVAIPNAVVVARVTGAHGDPKAAGFDTLELHTLDGSAAVRISDGAWEAGGPTTIGSIAVHGNLPKLLPVLEPRILAQLPATVADMIRATRDTIATAVGAGVSIESNQAKVAFLDLAGSIAWIHEGKRYQSTDAAITVFGARVTLGADNRPTEIEAEHVHVTGPFTGIVGGDNIAGTLTLRTGAARLHRGGGAIAIEANDIHASGEITQRDPTVPPGPNEHRIRDHEKQTELAARATPLLRTLELDAHAPMRPGTYGDEPITARVDAETLVNLNVHVANGAASLIEVTLSKPIRLFGEVRGLAVVNRKVSVDLGGLVSVVGPTARSIADDWVGLSINVPALVAHVMGKLRDNLLDEIRNDDGTGGNLAIPPPDWLAGKLAVLRRDLIEAIDRSAAYGRARATISGTDPDCDAQVAGSFEGGKAELRGNGSFAYGTGRGEATGVAATGVDRTALRDGQRIVFDGLAIERFTWRDPAH